MTFIKTLCLVLSDSEDVPGLPSDGLTCLTNKGDIVQAAIPLPILLRIARLQTLRCAVGEASSPPDEKTEEALKSIEKGGVAQIVANWMGLAEDLYPRYAMLGQLIIETVREAIPGESKHTGCEYVLSMGEKNALILLRRPLPPPPGSMW